MYQQYLQEFYAALLKTEFTRDVNKMMIHLDAEEAFMQIVKHLLIVKAAERQVFFVGNGGSCGIALHMTADFMKNGGIRTVNLCSAPLLTCMGNDFGYENTFSKAITLMGRKDDLLVTISSSGNSNNIIQGIHAAKDKEMSVLTLSGFSMDNRSRQLGNYNIYVPVAHYGIVESVHNLILQQIVDTIVQKEVEA